MKRWNLRNILAVALACGFAASPLQPGLAGTGSRSSRAPDNATPPAATTAETEAAFSPGAHYNGGGVSYPNGKILPASALPVSIDNAVSNIAELGYGVPSDVQMDQFNGMSVTLRNNIVTLPPIYIPKSKFNFIDTWPAQRYITAMAIEGETPATQDANYDSVMMKNMAAAASAPAAGAPWWRSTRPTWAGVT